MVQRRIVPAVLFAGPMGLLAAAAPFAIAQSRAANTHLERMLVSESGATLTVTLVANGEISGVLKSAAGEPRRLYIDLERVASAVPPVTPVGRRALRQIRVGQFSAQPLITRVVFDLGTVTGYRVEPGGSPRELRVVLESTSTPPAPPPASPYLDWFNAMDRRVAILLQATSQAIATRDGGLPPLASEWTRVQRDIESMLAPAAFARAHALLLEAAKLARLEAERGEAARAPDDASNPRAILARARAALPEK